MKLTRRDYQALKLGADLADAQRLLNGRNLPVAEAAAPMIGVLLGLLLFFGISISLVSSERGQTHSQIASSEILNTFPSTK